MRIQLRRAIPDGARCQLTDGLKCRDAKTAVLDSKSGNSADMVKRTIVETTLEGNQAWLRTSHPLRPILIA